MSFFLPDTVVDDVAVATRRLIIFSSMSALTDTEAVCNGGPVVSFLSNFLLSESYKKKYT